jgi:hypothetical protein
MTNLVMMAANKVNSSLHIYCAWTRLMMHTLLGCIKKLFLSVRISIHKSYCMKGNVLGWMMSNVHVTMPHLYIEQLYRSVATDFWRRLKAVERGVLRGGVLTCL